jgi:hypothetical protein
LEEVANAYTILVKNPEGSLSYGSSCDRWEDDAEMYLMAVVFEGVDWIHLAQDRVKCQILGNTVLSLQIP